MNVLQKLERRSRSALGAGCFAAIAIIGTTDFLTGSEMFFSVFYLFPVTMGTWFLGRNFGLMLSVVSGLAWIVGDVAAGARYTRSFIPIWNFAILMASYFAVVWLLSTLRNLQLQLEMRVQDRTKELRREMSERERLEKEILEVSEREQRRIGRDLHDSLCQHFTGTALACRVLEERLAAKALPEERDVANIVGLVEEGISMARSLARGIAPVEMEPEGLVAAFQAMATNITKRSGVQCVFESPEQVLIGNAATATHLYRIAQEAVTNALRHGKPKRIDVGLANRSGKILLTIEDDGIGLPETWQTATGLGTRIMAHRAMMIGGELSIEPNPTGGTLVTCSIPLTQETPK